MNNGLKKCLIIASMIVPGIGLVYSALKNRDLKKDNDKLTRQNKRLEARADILEKQNQDLLKEIDKAYQNK